MLVSWYLNRQIRDIANRTGVRIPSVESLKALAEAKQLIIPSALLFYRGEPVVRQYFAVQDQTMSTKQRVLQLAASLVQPQAHPIMQSISRAAKEAGLPPREVEGDMVGEMGAIAKLDRTWYVLGDEACMNSEQIELGVTIQTLAHQFELDGKFALFLAQKQPKRLLAIFACEYEVEFGAVESMDALRVLGVEPILLTSVKTRIAKGLGNRLSVSLIHSELRLEEKERIAASLLVQQPASLVLSSKECKLELGATVQYIGLQQPDLPLHLDSIDQLPGLLKEARLSLKQAKKRLFWCNI